MQENKYAGYLREAFLVLADFLSMEDDVIIYRYVFNTNILMNFKNLRHLHTY